MRIKAKNNSEATPKIIRILILFFIYLFSFEITKRVLQTNWEKQSDVFMIAWINK